MIYASPVRKQAAASERHSRADKALAGDWLADLAGSNDSTRVSIY